jgi:peroxiredoxin
MNQKNMKITLVATIIAMSLGMLNWAAFGGTPPQVGEVLPDITLPIPENDAEKAYLGIKGGDSFTIPQIKARVVIIEIFSMYCPYCQREAPKVNQLYSLIENDPVLRDKIKLLGIGAGNSPFEVEVFKGKYNVPFPLISDGDFTLYKSIGEVRTPYFFGVRINDDGTHQVFYSKLGEFGGPEEFLQAVVQLSGIK